MFVEPTTQIAGGWVISGSLPLAAARAKPQQSLSAPWTESASTRGGHPLFGTMIMKLISEAVSATFGLVTWYVAPIFAAIDPEALKVVAAGVGALVLGLFGLVGSHQR